MPQPSGWNLPQAAHLLRRATFGFTAAQLQQALADGPQRTIDRLLAEPPDYAAFEQSLAAITSWESTPVQTAQLTLYRMLHSPFPLREKATFLKVKPEALACFAPEQYRRNVKSPLEFALNLAIAFDASVGPAQLHAQLTALGQRFPDPGVARRWLNPFTLVGRSNLAAEILAKVTRFPDRRTILDTLLQNDAPAPILQGLARLEGRDLAQAIANLQEFQLV
jgi:hypothetical protein